MRGKTDDTCVLHPILIRVTCVTCVCSLGCTVYYTCREHTEMGNTGTGGKEGVHMEKTQVAWGRKGTGATDLQRSRQEDGDKG